MDSTRPFSFRRGEDAVRAWRNLAEHRAAQEAGRARLFPDYRIRVVTVIRDYGMGERDGAPEDGRSTHR